jgi:hypothetical protein
VSPASNVDSPNHQARDALLNARINAGHLTGRRLTGSQT